MTFGICPVDHAALAPQANALGMICPSCSGIWLRRDEDASILGRYWKPIERRATDLRCPDDGSCLRVGIQGPQMHLCAQCGGAWLGAGLDAVRKRKPVGAKRRYFGKLFFAAIAVSCFSVAPYFFRGAIMAVRDGTGYALIPGIISGALCLGAVGLGWQAAVMVFRRTNAQ